MNWLDLAIVLFIIIFLIIGIKKGFMSSILSSFSFIAIAIGAFFLYKPLSSLLNSWFGLENAIFTSYHEKLIAFSPDFDKNLLSVSQEDLHSFVKLTLNSGAIPFIPKIMFYLFLNTKSLYTKLHSSGLKNRTLADIVSSSYATFFTTIISYVITFLLLLLIVFLFKLLINKLREIGLIRVVDNVLGAFYGIIRALLILVSICLVIKLLSPISFMKPVTNYISNSFFGKLIYNQITNLLDNFFSYNDLINLIFK